MSGGRSRSRSFSPERSGTRRPPAGLEAQESRELFQDMHQHLVSVRESLQYEVRAESHALSCQLEDTRSRIQETLEELLYLTTRRHRKSLRHEEHRQRNLDRKLPAWNRGPLRKRADRHHHESSRSECSVNGGPSYPQYSIDSVGEHEVFLMGHAMEPLPHQPEYEAANNSLPFSLPPERDTEQQLGRPLMKVQAAQMGAAANFEELPNMVHEGKTTLHDAMRSAQRAHKLQPPALDVSQCQASDSGSDNSAVYNDAQHRPGEKQKKPVSTVMTDQLKSAGFHKRSSTLAKNDNQDEEQENPGASARRPRQSRQSMVYGRSFQTLYDEDTSDDQPSRVGLSLGKEVARAKGQKQSKRWDELTIEDILASAWFDNCIGTLILCNAATIGFQCNYMAVNETDVPPVRYQIFEYMFLSFFAAELGMRVWAHGWNFWTDKDAWMWNWFDVFVVSVQVVEVVVDTLLQMSSASFEDHFRQLRATRVLRLMRILRVMRVLRLISELRTIVSSIVGSMRSLLWTILLLFLMIYIVGIYFTQTLADRLSDLGPDHDRTEDMLDLKAYFGTLPASILSLYQAMSGGLDWDSLSAPLISEIGWVHGVAFSAYIAFAILALMNVVTGVFVQTALHSAFKEEQNFLSEQIVSLFNITSDGRTALTWAEVEEVTNDPKVEKEWKAIDVRAEEAHFLFKLFDIDNTQTVDFEEFLAGCLRLHGDAKAIDMLTLMQEFRCYAKTWARYSMAMQERLESLDEAIDIVSDTVTPFTNTAFELKEQMKSLEEQVKSIPASMPVNMVSDESGRERGGENSRRLVSTQERRSQRQLRAGAALRGSAGCTVELDEHRRGRSRLQE